jgi:SAM-dependent methyltransferase
MGSYYRQQLEDWLKTLNIKADVVYDVGGAQGKVKNRVKSWKVQDYKILDLPNWDLNKSWGYDRPEKLADLIFCLEVFEYLTDPIQALENIKDCLMPRGGKAYITFAFVYPHHNELEYDSLRYTEPMIRWMAKKVGLEISKMWYRRDKSGLLKQFYAADGMRAAKEYPHHDVTGFIVEMVKG